MTEQSEQEEKDIPEAKEVYVLMKNDYRISRNIRAQWFLKHLNQVIKIRPIINQDDCSDEIEIISAIPKSSHLNGETDDYSKYSTFRIVSDTKISFLAARYRLAFCIDLGPSIASVDIQHGSILFDEIFSVLTQSLESISKQFFIPYSQFLFCPQVHVTIIAHNPNCPSGIPQVLVQGWVLTPQNVDSLLVQLKQSLHEIRECVAKATVKFNEENNKLRTCLDRSLCPTPNDHHNGIKKNSQHILTADITTVNLLRYGYLALQLLPEDSSAGIIMITDGVLSFPSSQMLDSLLMQLRNSTVSCSFLKIGSPYHPFSCFGLVPYKELMQFIAAATCGAFFSSSNDIQRSSMSFEMNVCHQAFLVWNFQNTETPHFMEGSDFSSRKMEYWSIKNQYFYCVAKQSRVRKTHAEGNIKASVENLLSCRLREGYTVRSVKFDKANKFIEVRLLLPWKLSINFEYVIIGILDSSSQRKGAGEETQQTSSHFEVIIDSCYEFRHDVTCSAKKPIKSPYREAVIRHFWSYMKNLSHTDQMLVQLHSFAHNPIYYTIPESIKNGVPLFYWPLNSNNPELSSKNVAPTQFTSFWKPLCMLDINVWQKWMHTHRIGMILQHDMPLPKNLHLPNSSGRYMHIQCRQASAALNSLLTEYSSFVLVENHSYIKLLFSEADKPPTSFCVIRVSSKAPCMVIRLAFLGGLAGFKRNEIVMELRDKILNLNLRKRAAMKDVSSKCDQWKTQLPGVTDALCCFLLKKPVEKILIRYERLPSNFMYLVDDSLTNSRGSHVAQQFTEHLATNMLLTLSKYLHHQRWVWTMQCGPNSSMELSAVSKILSTLTKIRLQEGFHFAHSSYGIIYMVLEIPMKIRSSCFESEESGAMCKEYYPCVVQYLLFPPHTNTTFKDSMSEEEDTELPEADGELQLITECWVEPQYGLTTCNSSPLLRNFNGLSYKEISQAMYSEDLECVSVLTTFEHLCMMCNTTKTSLLPPQKTSSNASAAHEFCYPPVLAACIPETVPIFSQSAPSTQSDNANISLIPYSFSLMHLLPLCHQTEIMFSSFYQGRVSEEVEADAPKQPNDLLFEYICSFVKQNHERELVLSLQDCMAFLLQVHHRERDLSRAPQVPFVHPEFHATDTPSSDKLSSGNESKSPCCVQTKKVILRQDSRPPSSLMECMNIVERNVPRWRCFLKGISSSHFIVTVIPASFVDLEKLINDKMYVNSSTSPEKLQSPSTSHSTPSSTPVQVTPSASRSPKSIECFDPFSALVQDDNVSGELYFGPVTFPVYIYDCVLSSVTNHLIQKEENSFCSDSYEDHTFKYDEGSSLSAECSSVKLNTEEAAEECKSPSDTPSLKRQNQLVQKGFSKAFVYAIYRSLLLGMNVQKLDVEGAIDRICEESLLEIDITDFVYAICGHVKDFSTKINMKQKHVMTEMTSNESNGTYNSHLPSSDSNPARENCRPHHNCAFPLSLLQKHQPCEQLQQKHLDIKSRFSDILQSFFKTVPSHQDYYFFCPVKDESTSEDSACDNEDLSEIHNEDNESKSQNNATEDDIYGLETESHRGSLMGLPEDETSVCSHINTQSSLSSLENDVDSSYSQHPKAHSPPLFIHLTCSVRTKHNFKSCSLSSLPTCLGDVLECIDTDGEVDLDDLRITLDVTCLTLPSDIESPVVSQRRQYSTSFSSSSPIPETDRWKQNTRDDEDVESLSSESCPSDTVQGGTLLHLPLHQYEAVHNCVAKIKWLLQDEMASAALDSYPIDSSILKMVANHVSSSNDNSCCISKEIPLQFIFGPDISLDKFAEAFKRMSPAGYHLNEEDGCYYLVLDPESAKKLHRPFSSLDPPLGIAGKYLIVQQNPHCDDSTELKNIGYENEMVFTGKEFLEHSRNRCNVDRPDDDDSKSMEIPFSVTSSYVNKCRESKILHFKKQEEDTETEDGNDHLHHKRSSKKTTPKISRVKSQVGSRVQSLPSVLFPRGAFYMSHQRSHSCPCNFANNVTPLEARLPADNDSPKDKESSPNYEAADTSTGFIGIGIPDSNRVYLSHETSLESGSEVSTFPPVGESSPIWESPTPREVHSLPTGNMSFKFRPSDSTGSPVVCSETDFGSIVGSGHLSNTEDGYEGDSSDTDSGGDWLSTLDTRRPVLPKFWLIMNVCQSKVILHFHIRHRKVEDEELVESKAILSNVLSIITNICKEVNQTLLLQELHENRMCNQLLVPEGSDDIWKRRDVEPSSGFSVSSRKLSKEDIYSVSEVHERYLEANLKFKPGAFDCDVVWTTHFTLHPRLTTAPSGSGKSRGLQALRFVLNKFSVNNRENMYVYRERSGSVFYLRLQELACEDNHNSGKLRVEDSISLSGSCCSSVQSIPQKKIYADNEVDGFRSRVNSGHSDGDHQETTSGSGSGSTSSKKSQQCVAMFIHGIGEVGTEIKVDLVQVLQNRLNESLLDVIIVMLSRNPLCKLTPEDVQFIQNPTQAPTSQIYFTVPVKLLGHAHAIHMYLRQNMLHFLHNPKYTDNKKENHFKAFVNGSNEWSHVDDNDTFLYNYQQASGCSGSKGIACIVLSFVTGQGHPFQHLGSSPPNPSEYHDGLSENDYDELTSTSLYAIKSDRTPGPVALVRFQVWSVNKVSVDQLQKHLCNAVRHSLWDLLMEYRVLTAPVTDSVILSSDDFSCYSEPTTPIRMRKTGRSAVDPNFQVKDLLSTSALLGSKEMSSSVPDIAAKAQPSPSGVHDSTVFKFNSQAPTGKPDTHLESSPQSNVTANIYNQGTDKQNLNYMFHSIIKSFLQFGNNLGCPALSKKVFTLSSRHSVVIVLKEIQNVVKNTIRDSYPDIFLRVTNAMNADTEFVPFTPAYGANVTPFSKEDLEDIRPGTTKSFIIVARNTKQWKSYMGLSDFHQFNEFFSETLKSYQRYQTHICSPLTINRPQDSMPGSPTSVNKLNTPSGLTSPHLKSPGYHLTKSPVTPQNSASAVFVPRQGLLLMFMQDKELTVYLYNWAQDVTNSLEKQLTKLVQWHHYRDAFVSSIISQKLGLFHSQAFPCQVEKSERTEKHEASRKLNEEKVFLTWQFVDQLVNHPFPPREAYSTSPGIRTSTVSPKSSTILEALKNTRPPVPIHLSQCSSVKDPVMKYGMQLQETHRAQRRDMQDLRSLWQTRNTSYNNIIIDKSLKHLKRVGRHSHYCLTPILFSPSWRWKVAPIRDHTLEPLEQLPYVNERTPVDSNMTSRSRHSSGNSVKNADISTANTNLPRSRRVSGASGPNSSQSSPKPRRNPSEEAWHSTVCSHYLQEYIQYLHTLGFVTIMPRSNPRTYSRKSIGSEEDSRNSKSSSSSGNILHFRSSVGGPHVSYLIKSLLGGLLVFEVGLCDPYSYGHLYSIERSRLYSYSSSTCSSQFTAAFLDEVDKIKLMMHLHSFTYDYHLRTIHSYISGRQLIFRQGYHLTSFLDDFIKYYQKSPNCARNLLYAGSLTIADIHMHGHQLYNYMISHNQLYGMTVLRMVPIIQDSSTMMDTEFVLVELSAQKASYKDTNDVCQFDSFDVGLLINHNTTEIPQDKRTLVLNYYIILTSQRELYPKLSNFGAAIGSFQTVRFGSSQGSSSSGYSSRKTSAVSLASEKIGQDSSEEEMHSQSQEARPKISTVRSMCDEDVTYLGYFSSQETMMQQVLKSQADTAQTHLKGVVHRAAIHCRRDFLWSSLLPHSLKDKSSNKDTHGPVLNYSEFSELLDLVTLVPLDDLDANLMALLNMHISWYQSLSIVLKLKYVDSYREFLSPDGSSHFVVLTHVRCPDSFMLLSIDLLTKRAELGLVYREPSRDMEHTADKPNQRVLALHSLVEEFVNACCFHMWSGLLC